MLASKLDVSMLAAMLVQTEPAQLLDQSSRGRMILREPTTLLQQKVSMNQRRTARPMNLKVALMRMERKERARRLAKKAPMSVSRRLEMLEPPRNLLLVSCHHNHTHLMPLARHILLLVRSLRRVRRSVQKRMGGRA